MKKIAVLQSNYIPWKGYFDIIASVDEMIILDDVQYTHDDWRNRNKIKTSNGINWLTIPVGRKINRLIKDVELPQNNWRKKHLATLEFNYKKASFFKEVFSLINPIYNDASIGYLSEFNKKLIKKICLYLNIKTKISYSWDFDKSSDKNNRLIDLCIQANAEEYVSGPAAKNYIDPNLFNKNNIKLSWFNYDDYKPYPQLWEGFDHNVSIVDLLFNCGKSSSSYMKKVAI